MTQIQYTIMYVEIGGSASKGLQSKSNFFLSKNLTPLFDFIFEQCKYSAFWKCVIFTICWPILLLNLCNLLSYIGKIFGGVTPYDYNVMRLLHPSSNALPGYLHGVIWEIQFLYISLGMFFHVAAHLVHIYRPINGKIIPA